MVQGPHGTCHGAARQHLNRWKIARITFRESIADAVQLVRRWAWLQPQGIYACCKQETIGCPGLQLVQPTLIQILF